MFYINWKMPGKNCSIFNSHSFREAPGIAFFRIPTKDYDYSTNWRNNLVAVITCDRVIYNLKRQIKN